MKEKAEGVIRLGGWDPTLPGAADWQKRLVALTSQPGDAWAAPVTYASLQVLEQAVEGRARPQEVLDAIANAGPYQTIVGPVDLKTHVRGKQWAVGQWQSGQFVGVAPKRPAGCKPIVFPKPAWPGDAAASFSSSHVGRVSAATMPGTWRAIHSARNVTGLSARHGPVGLRAERQSRKYIHGPR
jgi:branched-chain amino acid transport system substrate-binding protein